MNKPVLLALFSASLHLTACIPGETLPEDGDDEESLAESPAPLITENALTPNALAPNALAPNALAPNALAPNALAPNALTALQAATENGDLARLLLKYTVGCALDATQVFPFSWTDADGQAHNEVYTGSIGIAPTWATAPLTDEHEQRLVSGCLAARVNWYGVSVMISIRSHEDPIRAKVSSGELSAYPNLEGVFWGNLFAPIPYMNACYHPGNADLARAAGRDCAAGHMENGVAVPCGPIALRGQCSAWCTAVHSKGKHYPTCTDRPGVWDSPQTWAIVTTALP